MKKPYKYYPMIIVMSSFLLGLMPLPKHSAVTFEHETIVIKTAKEERYYDTEMAINDEQQKVGLMYRTTLADDKGMLFTFPGDEKINMWMKNTLIPLDMLFIDKQGKIVYIAKNTQPNSLAMINAGDAQVSAVLELKAGASDTGNINIGDTVIYKVIKK